MIDRRTRRLLRTVLILCAVMLCAGSAYATSIFYQLTDVANLAGDTDRWEFSWTVQNNSLADPITDFVINFDFGPGTDPIIDSLIVEPGAAGWTEDVFQPSAIQIGGMYEAYSDTGIGAGQTESGFACSFDWHGTGTPVGMQYFELYAWEGEDPILIDSGYTQPLQNGEVPEWNALLLGAMGLAPMLCTRKRRR